MDYSKDFLSLIKGRMFDLGEALNEAVHLVETDYEPKTDDEKTAWQKWQDITFEWSNAIDEFDEEYHIRETAYKKSNESYERLKKLLTEE